MSDDRVSDYDPANDIVPEWRCRDDRDEVAMVLSKHLGLTCMDPRDGDHCADYRHIPQAERILDGLERDGWSLTREDPPT